MKTKFFFLCAIALAPTSVFAHAFGQQYNLPLPAPLYILGGAGALIVSFALLLFSPPKDSGERKRVLLGAIPTQYIASALRYASFILFTLAILIGIFGSANPSFNFAPLSFWIFFLLGFAYVSVFVTGLWEKVSPFELNIFFVQERLKHLEFPKWACHLPALSLYIIITWIELLSGGIGASPRFVAFFLIAYFFLSQLVTALFGKNIWREHFDVFGVFFRIIGLLAPFSFENEGITFRPRRSAALSKEIAESAGLILFILVVLAFTAFDGFKETASYVEALIRISPSMPSHVFDTIAFILFPLLFFVAYASSMLLVHILENTGKGFLYTLRTYVHSLVPIAVVYHFAHYFTLLLIEGQRIISIASDPLGFGWNLFGTRTHGINPGIISGDTVWYIQLGVIVFGHIVALYVSHLTTRNLVGNRLRVFFAELPLVAVMVFYTAFGLWILSRPFAI